MSRRQPRVLTVDDDPRMLDFIQVSLQQHGFMVLQASDGLEALQRARNDIPDIVLLDLSLPDIDGFTC